jgi:histidinol-phosphate aminotransferase
MSLDPKPGVLDIAAYVPGRSEAKGANRVFKLSSNESPFGPSPKAVTAFREAQEKIGVYADDSASPLRRALAEFYGIEPGRVVCGNGSNELLTLIANCYLRPGDEALMSVHGFMLYRIATSANSAVPIEVPEPERKLDVDAVLARVTGKTRMVYIANPNNPTGSYLTATELKRLHAELPASVLMIVDSAYAEYVLRSDYDAGIELARDADNVVMSRTFSKAYGLAGLRVGWLYAPEHVVDTLDRVRVPFNVNAAAQAAAIAALHDTAFTEKVVAHNETWRNWLTERIRALGLKVDDSVGNFILVRFGSKARAVEADRFLIARGLILREMSGYGLPDSLRLTVGSEEANRAAVDALRAFLAS